MKVYVLERPIYGPLATFKYWQPVVRSSNPATVLDVIVDVTGATERGTQLRVRIEDDDG